MAFEAPPVINPYTKRVLIVVDARNLTAATTAAQSVDAAGGDRTFTVGLSPTGSAPASHYWCSWAMMASEDTTIRGGLGGLVSAGRAWLYDAETWTPDQVLADRGLKTVKPAGYP